MAVQIAKMSNGLAIGRAGVTSAAGGSWSLEEILRPDTLIAAFEDDHTAEAAVAASLRLEARPERVWFLEGRDAANELRRQWQHRSLLRRLLGLSDEDRLVEELGDRLERHQAVIALRVHPSPELAVILASATRVAQIGFWVFRSELG